MLHEVLLALSGHPSPLFEDRGEDFPLTTAAERALLGSVGHLAHLHGALRTHLSTISTTHSSMICRAVANSLLSSQLSQFQQAILNVEREILSNDPNSVGAYNIVPLAGIVKKFDGWRRRMDWFWALTNAMLPIDPPTLEAPNLRSGSSHNSCDGTEVIEFLKSASQTGYADVAGAAVELERVAESVWMKILCSWILHGHLSDIGKHDFFIRKSDYPQLGKSDYVINTKVIPSFVDGATASSILFIGKTLNFFESRSSKRSTKQGNSVSFDATSPNGRLMQKTHIGILASIDMPIKNTKLTTAVSEIRKSLSNNLASEVLPVHEPTYTFGMLRRFFLGANVEFTDALIGESDRHLTARNLQLRVESKQQSTTDLAGIVMKQGELTAILSRTWALLAPQVRKDETLIDELEWAREHLQLTLTKPTVENTTSDEVIPGARSKLVLANFNDLLLSTPTTLNLELELTFGLFLSQADLHTYSTIHTYLLAIRRGQIHITKLWKEDTLRKDARFVSRSKRNKDPHVPNTFLKHWEKIKDRSIAMRKIWASSSAAVFMLSELGEYLVNSVIEPSWQKFHSWAAPTQKFDTHQAAHVTESGISTLRKESEDKCVLASPTKSVEQMHIDSLLNEEESKENFPKDPEALTNAHWRYLATVTESLLLDDTTFTRHLRNLLTNVDLLVGLVQRLRTTQSNLDLHNGDENDPLQQRFIREEEFYTGETDKASNKVDAAVQSLISRLRQVSMLRSSASRQLGEDGFEPWDNAGSVERLLSKLDLGIQVDT